MIDVSEFQGSIAWADVPQVRVLVRVTYGSTGVDARGAENLAAARARGLEVGGYMFLEDSDPAAEVDHFLAHFTPRAGGLRGMIDVERSQYSHPTAARVIAAVARYRELTGHRPIIYGSTDVLSSLHLTPAIGECPLDVANYGPNDGQEHSPGAPPPPWTSIAAHQYTSVGTCPGISGPVDLSHVYSGAAIIVPRHRPVLDHYRVTYVDQHHRRAAALTRTPGLWICRHPRIKRRGLVTSTPHRKER